jgi:hypothetical protein
VTGRNTTFWSLALAATLAVGCGSRTELFATEQDASEPVEAAPLSACSPANCPGCCDPTGACLPGTAQEACGIGGAACQACNPLHDICNPHGGGTSVVGVVCWSPCDLVKGCAAGCCPPDGQCLSGTENDACGRGTVCQNCAAVGKLCVDLGIEGRKCM